MTQKTQQDVGKIRPFSVDCYHVVVVRDFTYSNGPCSLCSFIRHRWPPFSRLSRESREEAYGIGSAALIPWQTFLPALKAGKSVHELSELYDVTTELINYRIKITAASNLYKARERERKER